MRVWTLFRKVLAEVASKVAKLRRHSDFVCSDCEKVDCADFRPVMMHREGQCRPNGVAKFHQAGTLSLVLVRAAWTEVSTGDSDRI